MFVRAGVGGGALGSRSRERRGGIERRQCRCKLLDVLRVHVGVGRRDGLAALREAAAQQARRGVAEERALRADAGGRVQNFWKHRGGPELTASEEAFLVDDA